MFIRTAEEIEEIVLMCKKYELGKPSGSMFNRTVGEIEKILEICKKYDLEEQCGSMFQRNAKEIEEIIEVCEKYKLGKPTGNMFRRASDEIEKIVEMCKKYNVAIEPALFRQKTDDLLNNIKYIQENYGQEYLKPLILSRSNKQLKILFPHLDSLGVLPVVVNSSSILTLTLDEIKERTAVLNYLGVPVVDGCGIVNSIYGLSKNKYSKKLNELGITSDTLNAVLLMKVKK